MSWSFCFFLFASVCCGGNLVTGEGPLNSDVRRPAAAKPLSVLLTAGLYSGHLFPLVSLGEELVRRGHNVTLCANVINGSTLYPRVPERVGIKFVSAGLDVLTMEEFEEIHVAMQKGLFSLFLSNKIFRIGDSSYRQIRAKVEEIGVAQFDIIVSEISTSAVSVYFHTLGKKSIVFSTLMAVLNPYIRPEWPTPLLTSGQSDDLTFLERFFNTLFDSLIMTPVFGKIFRSASQVDPSYKEVLKDVDVLAYPGLRIPLIYTTVLAFDFPKERYPLVEYVGPVLMQSLPHLDQDLQEWLNAKAEKTVIYISMGTTGYLSLGSAKALLYGVMATPYYAVWVIKMKNRQHLKDIDFKAFENRLFLAEWVPQQTVLKHDSIVMSILHCGLNGVQESLYNSLPVICLPFAYDQFEVAARIANAGVGISMYGLVDSLTGTGNKNLQAEMIEKAISKIISENYAGNASRISKMYKFAGGAQRAADLVEFYEDVGYDHLVPSFFKYEWSWVQRNNVDVWLLLGATVGVVGWLIWRVGKWFLSRLCC